MVQRPVPTGDAIRYGWQQMKARLGFWIVLEIIIVAVTAVPSAIGSSLQRGGASALATLVNIAVQVITIIVSIGLTVIGLKIYDGQPVTYADLFSRRNLFWRYLGGELLVFVVAAIGFILFIIPGIILLLTYAFTLILIVDRGLGVTDAMKTSGQITAGAKWGLLWFGFVISLVNLLGALALGVGLLFTIPTTWMAGVYIYRYRLRQAGPAPATVQPAPVA